MASDNASDVSRGPGSSYLGEERETDSAAGQPAGVAADRSANSPSADMIAPPSENTMGTLIVSIGLALFGIFWMVAANNIPNKTGFGSLGPGFLPFWAGLTLTLIAGGLMVRTIRERVGRKTVAGTGTRLLGKGQLRVAGSLAALLGYIVLLPQVHFFINTFLLSVIGLALSGEPLKPRLLVIAALISAALFAIFIYWLEIPLPGSRIFG